MKPEFKKALIVYLTWSIMFYIIMAFNIWDYDLKNWPRNYRNIMTIFGPILGFFLFLAVSFWKELFKEESPENE
jgi:hypothetical protein